MLIGLVDGSRWPYEINLLVFALKSVMSLVLLVIGLLPWAKQKRAQALVPALGLFMLGMPFLVGYLLKWEWTFLFLPVGFLLYFTMIILTRYGPVPANQRRSVGTLGYILLGLTLFNTPTLIGLSMNMHIEWDPNHILLLAPGWLFFSGIIMKISGRPKNGLTPIKPLLFSGELSIILSLPLFGAIVGSENFISNENEDVLYYIVIGLTVTFCLCVLLRGLLGNWLCNLLFGKPETTAAKTPDISIHVAAGIGSVKVVKQHLSAGTNVNAKDVGGETPLHKAALMGYKKITELLISAGADANAKDLSNETPLDRAVRFKRTEITKLLHEHEAKPSTVNKENTGLPPLLGSPVRKPAMFLSNYGGLVVMGGFAVLGLIGFLIGGFFDYNSLQGGLTGMAGAIWAPFALVLSPLSLFGGIFVLCWAIQHTRRYWYGWVGLIVLALASPFLLVLGHTITESIFAKSDPVALVAEEEEEDIPPSWTLPEQIDAAQDLFAKTKAPEQLPGYDPSNLQGNYGIKKIHLAVLCSDLADTQAQLTAGAEINAPDEVGNTPLHLALGLGETEIAEWLIGQGANLQAKANDGRAVVHAAAAGGQVELLEKLFAEGLKLDAKNALGQGPLHLACAAGQTETVEWLLGQGQTATAPDANGNTPLHTAVIHGRAGLAKPLIDAGADPKQLNTLGQAAFHLACATGQVGLVNSMLEQDVTLANLPDGDRFTPLYHAAINGNSRTVSLLLTHKAEIKAGDNTELGELFAKVLTDDVEYFERFQEQMNPFGGMGMGMMGMPGMMPFGMGMPGMGMNPYGMMGMGGMGMPEFDEEEFEGIGVDSDEDGFDDYDENLVGTDSENPDDTPTQEQVDTAQAEKDAAEIAEDDAANLVGEDESSDENEMDFEEEEETMPDFGGLPGVQPSLTGVDQFGADPNDPFAPPGMMPGLNPYGMGNPFGMPGPGMLGEAKKDAPKPEERQALMGIDANGNTVMHLVAAIGSSKMVDVAVELSELSSTEENRLGFIPPDLAEALGRFWVAEKLMPEDHMGMFGMGMFGMMPGMMPYGMGMPGMGMNPYGMMGMGGMGMQGMREDESEKTNLFPPLKKPLDLWYTESDIGVDSDGDGFDDHDENLTGHDPENPNDTPTQKEVDAAEAAKEEEIPDMGMPTGMPGMGMGMNPYGMMGMGGMGMLEWIWKLIRCR